MMKVLIGCLVLLLMVAGTAHSAPLLSEGFDDITTLAGAGWVLTNNSLPIGITNWFQGNSGVFSSYAGNPDAYIAANFENADFGGNISNWLITPVVSLGGTINFSFYTRTETGAPFPDRLEIRLSTNGASSDVGTTDISVGDFTTLLVTVNPSLANGGYPEDWTEVAVQISGLPSTTTGRFAFRYFVTDTSFYADYIGIDTVSVTAVPEPSILALLVIAMTSVGFAHRWFGRHE